MRALRDQRVKGLETELFRGCAAMQGGAIKTSSGSGNIEVDRQRVEPEAWGTVRWSFWQWKPAEDPISAGQIRAFHETWVNQLQLARKALHQL